MEMNLKQKELKVAEQGIAIAVMEERLRLRDVVDLRKEVVEIKATVKAEGKAEAENKLKGNV